MLKPMLPKAAAHLKEALDEILSFTSFPKTAWTTVWSNNPTSAVEQENLPVHEHGGDLS